MKTVTTTAAVLFLLALTATASADVLLLKSGGRVEGVVTEKGDRYVVKSLNGTAEVPRDQVGRRVEAPYVTEIYERKLARIDPEDADARVELALWCAKQGLRDRERENLEAAIRIDPDHEAARHRLGFVRFEGAWMMPEEAREAKLAKAGLVPFEGRWYTPEGLKAYLDAKKEMAKLRAEEEARRAAREEAERKRREEEERLAREEAERKAKEEALARAEEDRRARERLELENELLRERLREEIRRQSRDYGYGYGWYGYGYPYGVVSPGYVGGLSPTRPACPRRYGTGLSLDFRWRSGHFGLRGRVR